MPSPEPLSTFAAEGVSDPTAFLRMLFDTAVKAALPVFRPDHFDGLDPQQPVLVLGAGKAAASMADAFERAWRGPVRGLVITRHGYRMKTRHIEVMEGDHPTPSEINIEATDRLIALAKSCKDNEQIVFLVSGGGSALLCKPLDGLTLADKKATITALMDAGADIREINLVRRHLSAVKGGGLADLCQPHRVFTFAISDVVGDPPIDIASGPTVAETTTAEEALTVLKHYGIALPEAVLDALERRPATRMSPWAARSYPYVFVATPMTSLRAAAHAAEACGVDAWLIGDDITGEARLVGARHARMVIRYLERGWIRKRPCVLLTGGETTVTRTGAGKGGRNSEYLAGFFAEIKGHPGIWALAADTDGIDGSEYNAGAFITPECWTKALDLNVDAYLANNDCYSFFERLGGLLITGPTCTNVNDFRAIYIA